MSFRIKLKFLIIILLINVSCSKKRIEANILIKNGIVYNGVDTIPSHASITIKGDEIGRQAKLPIHISHIKCLGIKVILL